MPIGINGSGTITGVSVGGLPDGIVDTDMIAAKAATAAKIGNGGIIQVVQTVKEDTFSHNATAFTDITGLSASITPTSSSNKILVEARIYISAGISGGTSTAKFNFVRGSTVIGGPTGSGANHQGTIINWSSAAYMKTCTQTFLDSPNTTSATTYKIQIGSDGTAATLYVNRYYSENNYRSISTLTLMEVVA